MHVRLLLAAGGLALALQGAEAQDACTSLKPLFGTPPRLGEWAEMRMESGRAKEPSVARISFVGKEQRKGRDLYRLQMVSTVDGKRHVMQMLTPWDLAALAEDRDYDTELVMKMGDRPAMSMPVKGNEKGSGFYDFRKECAKVKYLGQESVTVPAGTYRAMHFSGPDGESWFSPEVPGWRMVKMVSKDGDSMVLTGTGAGAKNEITEKPMDMKAMMGNPEMMKRMMEAEKEEAR